MQTLSIFPNLLFLGLLAPALLRLTIGIIGILAGKERYKKNYKWFSLCYFITSFFLIVGMYTQIFSIVGILIVLLNNYADKKIVPLSGTQKILQILVGIVLFSFLFTGPGFLAFDLPL